MKNCRRCKSTALTLLLGGMWWFAVTGATGCFAEDNRQLQGQSDVQVPIQQTRTEREGYIGAVSDQNPRERHNGVKLSAVTSGGPADQAGIQVGDVVLAINGRYVATPEELKSEVMKLQPGSRAEIQYQRNASINQTYVIVGMDPDSAQSTAHGSSERSLPQVAVSPAVPQNSGPAASNSSDRLLTPSKFMLEDGTPVKLRISRTVSSADAHVGDNVDFEVLEEVLVGNTLVIPKGGLALGTVTDAQPKRRMARGGKLNMNIDSVRLVDGEKVALRAVKEAKGGGHTGAMTGAMVGTAIVFFPAAPLFLFMHGKDIAIPKGTEITAYINGNVPLNLAKFQQGAGVPSVTGIAVTELTIDISSVPTGADIELDGSFVGDTPSSMRITPGDHVVKITKTGYKVWERKLKAISGNIRIAAELESASGSSK